MSSEITLAAGAIFHIRASADLVRCEVINRSDVTPEEGARCAALMHEVLTTRVLAPQASYRGLLFDVRQGPPAFGPKTRASLELIFTAATFAGRRIAVLVSMNPTQRMQFGNLCLEHAPEHGRVFQSEGEARDWLTNVA